MLTHDHDGDRPGRRQAERRARAPDPATPAPAGPRAGLHPLTVLRLQQGAGNAAVARLVASGRRPKTDPGQERERPRAPEPPSRDRAGTSERDGAPVEGPSPEAAVPRPDQPAADHRTAETEPPPRDPAARPAPIARAADTAQKTHPPVARLSPMKVAPVRPPSAPPTPAPVPAAAVPTEQPATVEVTPAPEDGAEAERPARPGESDEELAHLDEQAEAGASGGGPSAPPPEPSPPEAPEAATAGPEPAGPVTAGPAPAEPGPATAAGAPGSAPPTPVGDLGAGEGGGAGSGAAPGPDPAVEEAREEAREQEHLHVEETRATEGETEADRGLAEATEQEAAESAESAAVPGAQPVTGESSGAGAEEAPAAGEAPPVSDDPAQVQAEAGAAVDTAGDDVSGEGAADAAGGAGGGGGGGGAGGDSGPDTPPPAPPDLSGADPAQALAGAAALPPAQLAGALETVSAGASRAVAEQRTALAANPPEVTRGAGAAGITAAPGAPSGLRPVRKAADRTPVAVRQPKPLPVAPAAPVERVPTPQVVEAADGKVSPDAARDVQASVRALPTSDPGLAVTPGAAPRLPLAGDADPQQVREQHTHVEATTGQAATEGLRDAAEPMGEGRIYPTVPAKRLRGEVGAAGGGAPPVPAAAAAGAAVGSAADSEAASVVAQQERGDEIRGAVTQGAAQITGAKSEHARQSAEERQRSAQEVAGLERTHAQEQDAERTRAQTEVQAHRRQWTDEQTALVASHRAEAGQVAGTARQTVVQEQTQAEQEAAAHHKTGEEEAGRARKEGEQDAAQARKEGEKESSGGGFFSWAASAMKSLVDKVKNGIKAAFEKARAAVRAAIQKAQQLATAVIEKARQAVVAAIRLAGAALIAIGDRLLAAFPGVRDRFRKAIQDRVKAAEAAVNRLAEGLERGVKSALDLLGKGLDAALGLLEKGMLAAVDAVKDAVKGALDFAKKAIEALGTFAVIAKDIAKGPGRWISMLGSAVVSGIRDHLWGALKKAVKQWFNDKVEEITGFGKVVWNLLKKGGISLAQVGKMVWQGIVAAIPAALIALLIEKLVSMIVPAAGAVLAVIQGIQAAWGAIQRVIQAISAFIAFLKGVLGGSGAVLFANALAATAVAVIEFVAQWLLKKLKGAATGVGGKLREIAKKIGARLKSIGKALVSGTKKAAGAAMRAVKAVGRGIVRGVKAVGRGIARGARYLEKKLGRFGAAMGRGIRGAAAAVKKQWEKLKAKFAEWRDKIKKKWEDWKKGREERRAKALERARRELPPKISALLGRGVSKVRLWASLLGWRLSYGLRVLAVRSGGDTSKVVAANSPEVDLLTAILESRGRVLEQILHKVSEDVVKDPEVRKLAEDVMKQREAGHGTQAKPILLPSGQHAVGTSAADLRALSQRGSAGPLGVRAPVPASQMQSARAALREGREFPGIETFQHGTEGGLTRELASLGPRGALHPEHILVGGVSTYWLELKKPPSNPQAFMKALSSMERNEKPPAHVLAGLAPGELDRVRNLARLSQVESGRFGAGPASTRLGTMLAAETPPGRGGPLSSFEERFGYKHQPETGFGAQQRGAAAQQLLGLPQTEGVGPPPRMPTEFTKKGEPSKTYARVTDFIRMHANLAVQWLSFQMAANPRLFTSLDVLEKYVDKDMREHLRATLFAARSSGT